MEVMSLPGMIIVYTRCHHRHEITGVDSYQGLDTEGSKTQQQKSERKLQHLYS